MQKDKREMSMVNVVSLDKVDEEEEWLNIATWTWEFQRGEWSKWSSFYEKTVKIKKNVRSEN